MINVAKLIILLSLTTATTAARFSESDTVSDQAAFFRAARGGNTSCLKKLIAQGIDINSCNTKGYSPLMIATDSGDCDTSATVEYLLQAGADPNRRAHDGTSPLELATMTHRPELATKIFHAITTRNTIDLTTQKPSIALLIADLKFGDDGSVKILELGEGPLSYFKGYDALYAKGLIWKRFWQHLAAPKLPIWYVGNQSQVSKEQEELSIAYLKSVGGSFHSSLHSLEKNDQFKKIIRQTRAQASQVAGYIILRNHNTNQAMLNYFKNSYPEVVIVDDVVRPFVSNKFMTNLLFDQDQDLSNFRPRCNLYPKGYSPELVAKIAQDFQEDKLLVIKPLDAANGWGVIIINQKKLATTLQKIFGDPKQLAHDTDVAYTHWLIDTNKHFIVEAFTPSKIITVDKQRYDATMRQVFVVTSDPTGIKVDFIASYWKLPSSNLDTRGSAIERHKSHVTGSKKPSAKVAAQDDAAVRAALQQVIPCIYKKMLQCSH